MALISAYNFIYKYFIETCIATFFTVDTWCNRKKNMYIFFHTYSLCVFYLFWLLKVMKSVKCECSVLPVPKRKKKGNKMSEYHIHSCHPLLLPLERVQCISYVSVCVCLCICFCTHIGLSRLQTCLHLTFYRFSMLEKKYFIRCQSIIIFPKHKLRTHLKD